MKWNAAIRIGDKITVDGEKMKITDICKPCRLIWAEDKHHYFRVGINRQGKRYIKDKRLKPLE